MAKKTKPEVSEAARWQREIQLAKKHFEPWQNRGEKVVQRYRDDRDSADEGKRRFAVLWSNVQTLLPALYSRPPKVQVSRRYNDADPVARCASIIIERAVDVELEKYDIGCLMQPAVEDRLLPGRGTGWVRYDPKFRTVTPSVALQVTQSGGYALADGTPYKGEVETREGMPFGSGEPQQEVEYECTPLDYVYWKDFLCSPARTWEEVRWVARRVYLGRAKLKSRFGDKLGEAIPLDSKPPGLEEDDPAAEVMECAVVWELWDRDSKCAYWIHETYSQILDKKADPLKLAAFFPTAKPLFATTTSGSVVPVPDYCQYQDQAKELDDLTDRIASLTKSLKVAGVYDQSAGDLQRLLQEGVDNQLIPVERWAAFAEKGGFKGTIDFLPIEQVIKTVIQLYNARTQVKNDLYEITGIADVIRGASDASETATAQGIKAKYAGLRLSEHQSEVERFARDMIRLKAEIMAEKYAPENLILMSGIMQTPEGQDPNIVQQAIELLKSPAFRDFRIDVETRSMAQMDEQADRQERMAFLGAVGQFMNQAAMAVKEQPAVGELVGELLRFGVRGFRIGRELESIFDRTIQAAQSQPPGVPPEMQKQMQQAQQQLQQQSQKLQQGEQALLNDRIQVAEDQIKVESDKKLLAKDVELAKKDGEILALKAKMAGEVIQQAASEMQGVEEARKTPDLVASMVQSNQEIAQAIIASQEAIAEGLKALLEVNTAQLKAALAPRVKTATRVDGKIAKTREEVEL